MKKRVRHTELESARMYHQASVVLATGKTIPQVCRKVGISEATFHRWRRKFARPAQFQMDESPMPNKQVRFKQLESENKRLKLLVAELVLENAFLKDRADASTRSQKF